MLLGLQTGCVGSDVVLCILGMKFNFGTKHDRNERALGHNIDLRNEYVKRLKGLNETIKERRKKL